MKSNVFSATLLTATVLISGGIATATSSFAAYDPSKIADWCPKGDFSGNLYDNQCLAPSLVGKTILPTTSTTSGSGSGTDTTVTYPDYCPKGDYTPSRYDENCGFAPSGTTTTTAPVTTTAPSTSAPVTTTAPSTSAPVTTNPSTTTSTSSTTPSTTTTAPSTTSPKPPTTSSSGSGETGNDTTTTSPYTANPAMEAELTSLINAERQRQGLNTLTESEFGSRTWSYQLSAQYDATKTISHDPTAVNDYNEIVTMGYSAQEAFNNFTNSEWHRYTYLMPSKTGIDSGVTCRTNPYNNTQLCAFTVRFK